MLHKFIFWKSSQHIFMRETMKGDVLNVRSTDRGKLLPISEVVLLVFHNFIKVVSLDELTSPFP